MIKLIIKDVQDFARETGIPIEQVLIPADLFDAHCIEHSIIPVPGNFFGPTTCFRWDSELWAVRAAPMDDRP